MRLNLWPLPLLILTKRLLLQRARSNMVPFNLALEANNLGRILDLFLALVLVDLVFLLDIGLILIICFESKSTLVIGGSLHTQHIDMKLNFIHILADLGFDGVYPIYWIKESKHDIT